MRSTRKNLLLASLNLFSYFFPLLKLFNCVLSSVLLLVHLKEIPF